MSALFLALVLSQACPSYSASSTFNTGSCATNAVMGTNPTVAEWQTLFTLVSKGPAEWVDAPPVADMREGCGKPTPTVLAKARFPCELIKAMAMQETLWRHFCVPTSPADQVGRASQTIIARDCGYGIGQVTTGMRTFDASPSFNRDRVAAEPFYNLASGMQILSDKWRIAKCVGDRRAALLEHWYIAAWAYNGLASVNNPNKTGSTTRGVWNPRVGGTVPYQERVWGWMEYPPTADHWPVTKVAYPKLTDIGANTPPPEQPQPTCASPTDCTSTRPSLNSACLPPIIVVMPDAGVADGGIGTDGGSGEPTDGGPVTLEGIDDALGRPGKAGCGCGSGDGDVAMSGAAQVLLALGALFFATRRRSDLE